MKIWTVEEYIVLDEISYCVSQFYGHWVFSTKEKAIQAVYNHLRELNIDEEDIKNHIKEWDEDDELHHMRTKFDNYDMYDCRYDIRMIELDQKIEI